ncbi:MAG: hypothetical protein SNI70_10125 [Rikenellaceae bacterium]
MNLFQQKLPYVAYMPFKSDAISDNNIKLGNKFDFSKINDKILDSETVEIYGLGFTVTFDILYQNHKDIKAKLKILLMDNKQHAIHCATLRSGKNIEDSVQFYDNNFKKIKELAENKCNDIQLKVLDILPPYNIFIFDRDTDNAEIHIHIAGWDSSSVNGRPFFIIYKKYNKFWFDYFVDQFDLMWDKSNII